MRVGFVLSVATIVAGCGDGITSPNHTSAHVLGPVLVADTAGALLAEPLKVQVTDADGRPLVGTPVRFTALGIPDPGSTSGATIRLVQDGQVLTEASVNTDSAGVAAIAVRFGCETGKGAVALKVGEVEQVDTARYSVIPAALNRISLAPTDTAVLIGNSYLLRVATTDRCGNVVSAAVTFSSGPGVRVDATGRVEALGYSRERVTASSGNVSTVVPLSVVPRGRLAGFAGLGFPTIAVFSTVGSDVRVFTIPNTLNIGIFSWSVDGNSVIVPMVGPDVGAVISVVSMSTVDGALRPILPDTSSQFRNAQTWPAMSRNGEWIYMAIAVPGQGENVWRVHADGTALSRIALPLNQRYSSPTPSPDGRRLAYLKNSVLQVVDLDTGAILEIPGMGADVVRWSPTGEQIATRGGVGLFVVNADGTGKRSLGPATIVSDNNIGWSPDGEWIVYRDDMLYLVQVSTGLSLPLPFSGNYRSATWAPNPGTTGQRSPLDSQTPPESEQPDSDQSTSS